MKKAKLFPSLKLLKCKWTWLIGIPFLLTVAGFFNSKFFTAAEITGTITAFYSIYKLIKIKNNPGDYDGIYL